MFYTYVLKSLKDSNHYTGHTSNLIRRLNEHNSGLSKHTKSRIPFEIIYFETFNTKGEAMKREKFFKTGKGRDFLKLILKYNY